MIRKRQLEKTLAGTRKQLADYAMVLDMISRLSGRMTETQIVEKIFDMYQTLSRSGSMAYLSMSEAGAGRLQARPEDIDTAEAARRLADYQAHHGLTESGRGFFIQIDHGETTLGILEIDDLPLPEDREHYLNLSLNFTSVLAIAIEKARLYEDELGSSAQLHNYANLLSVLHYLGLSLNQETDRDRLLKMVLENAAELTSAGVGVMTLIKDDRTDIISLYRAEWYEEACELGNEIPSLHRSVARLLGDTQLDVKRILNMEEEINSLPVGHMKLRGLLIGTLRDTRDRIKGHFMLSNKANGAEFTDDDEEIISLLAAQSSVAMISAENFERERHIAESLQDALLPDAPIRDDIEVGLLYRTAGIYGKVGGDFYDFVELDGNRVAIVVGDVCGKGLQAATYTAMIKYMLRAYLGEDMYPGDCLTRLNVTVNSQIAIEKFITVLVAIIDTVEATVTYASAGHPPPLICRDDTARPLKTQRAAPLGVIDELEYLSSQASLAGACSLIMYTDGLLEARPQRGEPFGEQRIIDTLAGRCCLPAQKIIDSLLAAVIDYSVGALRDDIAMVAVRLTGNTSEI